MNDGFCPSDATCFCRLILSLGLSFCVISVKSTYCDFSMFNPSTSQVMFPERLPASISVSHSCKRISAIDGAVSSELQHQHFVGKWMEAPPFSRDTWYIFKLSPPSTKALSSNAVQSVIQSESNLLVNLSYAFPVSSTPSKAFRHFPIKALTVRKH